MKNLHITRHSKIVSTSKVAAHEACWSMDTRPFLFGDTTACAPTLQDEHEFLAAMPIAFAQSAKKDILKSSMRYNMSLTPSPT
jgi:hypothetical protein